LASFPTKSLIVTAEFIWAALQKQSHFSCRICLASNPHNSLIFTL